MSLTTYTPEIGQHICDLIATTTKSLVELCTIDPQFPGGPDTIYRWIRANPEFAEMYLQARRNQVQLFVDQIIFISDDDRQDYAVNKHGELKVDKENIHRARLMIDTRKWLASKLMPKVYGERMQNDTNVVVKTHEEWLKEITDE